MGGQVSHGNRAKVAGLGHGLERVCRLGIGLSDSAQVQWGDPTLPRRLLGKSLTLISKKKLITPALANSQISRLSEIK